MSDGEHSAASKLSPQRLLNEIIRYHVNGGSGLVQDEDGGWTKEGPGEAQQLALPHAAKTKVKGLFRWQKLRVICVCVFLESQRS